LLLVVLVMVVVALLWWVMPGGGGSESAAAGPGAGAPQGHHPSTPSTTTSTGDTPGQQPAVTHHPTPGHANGTTTSPVGPAHPPQHQPTQGQPTKGQPTKGHTTPTHPQLPLPSGPCDPRTVFLSVAVANAPEGDGTTVGLRLSTKDGSTCSLGITPSLLETRITSGDVVIWQSGSCPDALPAKNVVVRPKPSVVYSYTWDGQINPDSCSATNRIALPGGYWAEAALIGGEPHKAYFEVTAPTKG
jgi:hypothetical protein